MIIDFKKMMGYGYKKKLTKKESKLKYNKIIGDIIEDIKLHKKQVDTIIKESLEDLRE
tara:strand:+ start:63 stop:236 length:174 start_codon:yes stop_codon:yes gene_type:complete